MCMVGGTLKEMVDCSLFPDAKDITESMGALQAATHHCFQQDPLTSLYESQGQGNASGANITSSASASASASASIWKRKDVLCLCVGDGSSPRTAGTSY